MDRGIGALGSLSALGGIAFGSAAFMTGGAVVALGGVMVTLTSKARYSSKSTAGARILLESKVRQLLQECSQAASMRQRMVQHAFQEPAVKAESDTLMDTSDGYEII